MHAFPCQLIPKGPGILDVPSRVGLIPSSVTFSGSTIHNSEMGDVAKCRTRTKRLKYLVHVPVPINLALNASYNECCACLKNTASEEPNVRRFVSMSLFTKSFAFALCHKTPSPFTNGNAGKPTIPTRCIRVGHYTELNTRGRLLRQCRRIAVVG